MSNIIILKFMSNEILNTVYKSVYPTLKYRYNAWRDMFFFYLLNNYFLCFKNVFEKNYIHIHIYFGVLYFLM
jgi:hypothetical protein